MTSEDERLRFTTFISRTTKIESKSDSINDGLHFLLSADGLVTNWSENDTWTQRPNPQSFGGLSGTPVFAVNDDPFQPNWIPNDYKIIGIQSSFIQLFQEKRAVMRVVRIETMFEIIKMLFPTDSETLGKLGSMSSLQIRKQLILPRDLDD